MSTAEKLAQIQQAIVATRNGARFMMREVVDDTGLTEVCNSLDEIALNVGELTVQVTRDFQRADTALNAIDSIRKNMIDPTTSDAQKVVQVLFILETLAHVMTGSPVLTTASDRAEAVSA